MSSLGQLRTNESIEKAMRIIRDWLQKLNINGLTINTNYDARMNVAVLKFRYKEKDYEFRSNKQSNCRLNMWGIARVMEYKVRASIMGIEDFEKSMQSYLAIEDKSGISSSKPLEQNQKNYIILGISHLASNEEIKKRYIELQKNFHPDLLTDLKDEAKKMMQDKIADINVAYSEIKKERQLS
jgi:DnaJ-domain-containing protein 1